MTYYIYIHICLPDVKAYIGWSANPKIRWRQHCAAKDNRPFYNAIRKYGKECFESQILFRTTNLEEVKQKEIEFIKQFDTQIPNGYNITLGGDGGNTFTNNPDKEKTREKLRATSTGRYPTKETKVKMKNAQQGKKRSKEAIGNNRKAQQGKKHSKETIEKMKGNQNAKGYKHTKEAKEKNRKSHQGKKHSKETIEKMRKAKQGKKNVSYRIDVKYKRLQTRLKKLEKEIKDAMENK